MFNKILVFGGLALMAILIVENMVVPSQAFVFLSRSSTTWMLSFVSLLIGIGIGFGIKGMLNNNPVDDDESLNF